MPFSKSTLPFRLGTTSYIIPDEILPNVRYLADKVSDVELVLFEVDDGPSNLPSTETVQALNALAAAHGLTYTVHLPLDLKLGADGEAQHVSLVKARRVIDVTRDLKPWAYVLHLGGKEVRASTDPAALKGWQEQSLRALELAAAWAGDPTRLAVENLEGYPLDFYEPVLARIPVSRCVDVGHLWLDGHDPLPYLESALPRTRVIHMHGIGTRDHQSLRHIPFERRDAALQYLHTHYRGVMTLEVFNEADLQSSLEVMAESLG